MAVIGIDPGLNGGIAICWRGDATGRVFAKRFRMPVSTDGKKVNPFAVLNAFARLGVHQAGLKVEAVYVEAVNGIKGQSASASFTFGEATGTALGATLATFPHSKLERISKVRWAGKVGLRVGASKSDAVVKAQQFFGWFPLPGCRTITDGEAEAGLIAYAGLLIEEGKSK